MVTKQEPPKPQPQTTTPPVPPQTESEARQLAIAQQRAIWSHRAHAQ